MHSATFCHPNKTQVNDGEAELKLFKYLLVKSTLSNTCCSVRLNFILEWLADNLGRLTEKWRIFPFALPLRRSHPLILSELVSELSPLVHCISKSVRPDELTAHLTRLC